MTLNLPCIISVVSTHWRVQINMPGTRMGRRCGTSGNCASSASSPARRRTPSTMDRRLTSVFASPQPICNLISHSMSRLPPQSPTNARQAHAANVFTFDTMQKLFDLKIRAKANETRNELPMQKPMLLDIPTASGKNDLPHSFLHKSPVSSSSRAARE